MGHQPALLHVGPDPQAWIGTVLPILAQVILVVVVLRRRHRTDPVDAPDAAVASPA